MHVCVHVETTVALISLHLILQDMDSPQLGAHSFDEDDIPVSLMDPPISATLWHLGCRDPNLNSHAVF